MRDPSTECLWKNGELVCNRSARYVVEFAGLACEAHAEVALYEASKVSNEFRVSVIAQ